MGKGDKRTKRGKIFKASHGAKRASAKTLRRRLKKASGAKKTAKK